MMAALGWLFFLCAGAQAQPAIEVRRWDASDGLPSSTVTAFTHDTFGYLWIGTEMGLARSDGYSTEVFPVQPGVEGALQDGYVRALVPLSGGDVLVGTSRGGVHRYVARSHTFEHFRLDPAALPGGAEDFTCAYALGADGELFVGSRSGIWRLAAPPGNPIRIVPLERGVASGYCSFAWHEGYLWAAAENEVVKIDRQSRVVAQPLPASHSVGVLKTLRAGDLLAGSQHAVHIWEEKARAWRKLLDVPGEVRALEETPDGTLWVGTDRGLFRWKSGSRAAESLTGLLPYPFVWTLYAGEEGVVWVGTTLGGMLALTPPNAPVVQRHLHAGREALDSGVKSFHRDGCGVLWLGTFRQGLTFTPAQPRRGCPPPAPVPPELKQGGIWSIAPSHTGGLWIARFDHGLVHYEPTTGRVQPASAFGLPEGLLPRDLLVDRQKRLWIADAVKGLYRFSAETGQVRHWPPRMADPSGFPHPFAWSLIEHPSGGVFAATTGGGLAYYDEQRDVFERFAPTGTTPRLPDSRVLGLGLAHDGSLWVGLFGSGLPRLDARRKVVVHYPAPGRIPNGVVSNVHEDRRGRVWLTTQAGLSLLDPQTGHLVTYGEREGMSRLPALVDALWEDEDGTLLIGTAEGYVSIEPEAMVALGPPPPPVVTRMVVGDPLHYPRPGAPRRPPLALRHDHPPLMFSFASMPVAYPEEVAYEVRLDGLDTLWRAADGPTATYHRLPPGQYTMQVRASRRGSRVHSDASAVAFAVRPPYWSTFWFRGGVLLLLVGLGVGAHRLRVAHLLAIERTRRRIADDLHDDLGARLATLAGRLELAEHLNSSAPRYSHFALQARQLTQELRDLVWLIDSESDTLPKLAAAWR